MKFKMPKEATKSVTIYDLESLTLNGVNTYICCYKNRK